MEAVIAAARGGTHMTDNQLLQQLQFQHPDSMELLMQKYHRYVYTVIANVLGVHGTHEDIEELAQDTFYAVWSHADAIHGSLKAYLCTTARNRAKSWLRGRRELPMALDYVELPDACESLEDAAQQQELARYVRSAIDQMRPRDREIFLRYYYYLQGTEEIAEHMGIPIGTVCSRLARGRKHLKRVLSKEVLL